MKKSLIALVAIMMLASSSFAGVSFLTADSVGVGKWAVLGMYATNHVGNNANQSDGDPAWQDANSLGVRGEYGLQKDLDLLIAYSMDTLPNIKAFDMDDTAKQTSGSTTGLGVKYTVMKGEVNVAGLVGYEISNVGLKGDVAGSGSIGMTTLGLGCIASKQIGTVVAYGSIGYKMLTQTSKWVEDTTGNGLAWNIGAFIGIAKDQAVAIEYNTENRKFDASKMKAAYGGTKTEELADSVSGISLGYVYMF